MSYTYAVWRRKCATAVVKLKHGGSGKFVVKHNGKSTDLKVFFGGNIHMYERAIAPLKLLGDNYLHTYDAEIAVSGWGMMGIADAIRLGFARALSEGLPERRTQLKPYGLLQRDPRIKERKKFGLKKARKRPKWSKR